MKERTVDAKSSNPSTLQTSQAILSGLDNYAKAAWAVLAYNIGVILWGAYVRATSSGAGCGGHWPLCDGQVVPESPGTAMLIEYSHRLSSGLVLLLSVGLLVWAFRRFPAGHIVRLGASVVVLFTITEALVGAGLVLFGLVGENDSMWRAVSISIHLINTFLLVAALALTAFWASGGRPLRLQGQGPLIWFIGIGLVGVLIIGITGAITALGDTLFPSGSLAQGLEQDLNPAAESLVRLRVIHPVIALAVGLYVMLLARAISTLYADPGVRRLATLVTALVLVQWAAGLINVLLLAPVWLQLVHLLLADLAWISLVLMVAVVLGQPERETFGDQPVKRLLQAMMGPG